MKYLLLLLAINVMSGCFVYSSKNDCIYGLTSTQCFGETYPPIAHYQKPFSLGKTNSEKRRNDVESCGGLFDKTGIRYEIKGSRDKKGIIIMSVVNTFESCMKEKGYIYLSNKECGRKNSTSDKGVCNE